MKRICAITSLLILLIYNLLNSQTISTGAAGDLEGMFRRIRENLSSSEKRAVNDSVRTIIENYAASDTVFIHRFKNLRYLGQITSPDSLVKIISWNLIFEDGGNRYFCYIIRRPDPGAGNEIYKLSGFYNEAPIITDTIYSESGWYGALYYDIRPFKTGNETSYVVLGIDYGNSFITRKIIDVLSFGPGKSLVFGKRCFADGKILMPRVVFEFAATAVMSLKFVTDVSIVFDHLSLFSPGLKNNRQFYGPDFSFDSYNFENGLWRLRSNIDIRNKE
ncbi:MAG: hypothetical protein C0408_01445 [Odoribacter sp.]|nr:hypothetical protein [Odoribacter sp.]